MQPAWLNHIAEWISSHPLAAGLAIFLIGFCDALAVVGILVPALPLLFAVGAMIGIGQINGAYALAAAALGAYAGDSLSYWLGRRYGNGMRGLWLFKRYPTFIDRAERMFKKHDLKAIVIARFVGAVRPFVPAIAGMAQLPYWRFGLPSLMASFAWAALFLAPGWIFGTSYEAVAAVADRLALVLLIVAAVVAGIWALVVYASKFFALHADRVFAAVLRWTRSHPRLGKYIGTLVDPKRPESPSILLLAVAATGSIWVLAVWLFALVARGGPLAMDLKIYSLMFSLRNPLADQLMAAIASIADIQVLLPAFVVGLAWLFWRKRYMAATHWIFAVAVGLGFSELIKRLVSMPRPPTAPSGFGFPSVSVLVCAVMLGFFAVLIARELPSRRRVWPYMLAALITVMVAFARVYLGAHWASDVAMAMTIGVTWLLIIGIAYRNHVNRAFWMRPVSAAFYTVFVAAMLWHVPGKASKLLSRFEPPAPAVVVSQDAWWSSQWRAVRPMRNHYNDLQQWPLDLQMAGELSPLINALTARGWQQQEEADWLDTLRTLDDRLPANAQAILPSTVEARAEFLLMYKNLPNGERDVLRVWHAPARLEDGTPLWVATTQRMQFSRRFRWIGLWRPTNAGRASHEALVEATRAWPQHTASQDGLDVLRVDLTKPAAR
jgi:membrane protein DedA with SNARE-associated domain/membrane-associated phospholipid phosphatase